MTQLWTLCAPKSLSNFATMLKVAPVVMTSSIKTIRLFLMSSIPFGSMEKTLIKRWARSCLLAATWSPSRWILFSTFQFVFIYSFLENSLHSSHDWLKPRWWSFVWLMGMGNITSTDWLPCDQLGWMPSQASRRPWAIAIWCWYLYEWMASVKDPP